MRPPNGREARTHGSDHAGGLPRPTEAASVQREAGWSSIEQARVPGTDQPGKRADFLDQAWNDEPQPQVPETFGLPNLKPEPLAPST